MPFDPLLIGYARVSTDEQDVAMQREALIRAGVHPDMIFEETISGASGKRPARDLARKQCRDGSTLVVWKLDRIGRDALDLLSFIRHLEADGIGLRSVTEYIDTKTAIGKLAVSILAIFAEFERNTGTERTRAGIDRAMAAGKRFGQPSKMTDTVRAKLEGVIASGGTVEAASKAAGVAVSTIRLHYKGRDLERIRERKTT